MWIDVLVSCGIEEEEEEEAAKEEEEEEQQQEEEEEEEMMIPCVHSVNVPKRGDDSEIYA